MKCYLCKSENHNYVEGFVRDKPQIKILKCRDCGLVFLESQDHVREGFYEDGGMEKSDASASVIETMDYVDTEKRFKEFYLMLTNKRILDFGCGRGSFLMKLKKENITPYLYAVEPNKHYGNRLKEHITVYEEIGQIPDESIDFITFFHVLEHLSDPIEVLKKLYDKLQKGGNIIVETPNADDALLNLYGSKAFSNFTYWSCHLYLFNNRTLRDLLGRALFKTEYLRQYQRYTLANHLFWLAKGKPGGHIVWGFLDDDLLQKHYEKKLSQIGQCDTIIALAKKG